MLIHVDQRDHLTLVDAEAHYRTHENSIENEGYVKFLHRAIDPLLPYLTPTMRGLDYGSGPGPTLSQLLRRRGHECSDYDPLFNAISFEAPYDYIFATECFEHFIQPAVEISRIAGILRPGGYLVVMTEPWTDLERFRDWYYTRDPTHVSFYHNETFDFFSHQFGFRAMTCDDPRVRLFQRVSP